MILEFTIKNFGSIKEETTFSFVAESSKSKSQNIFEATIAKEEKVRVLTSSIIYGPNASGKTTILKAFRAFLSMIKDRVTDAGDEISQYNPFLFDEETKLQSTAFSLSFIGLDSIKYVYSFSYNSKEITSETLEYFPKGSSAILLERNESKSGNDELINTGVIQHKTIVKVFKNKLLMSAFGQDFPHEIISNVYVYFSKFKFQKISSPSTLSNIRGRKNSELFLNDDWFRESLNELIKIGDLKINEVVLREINAEDNPYGANRIVFHGIHDVYSNREKVNTLALPFSMESKGTNVLFNLGGYILEALRKGEILLIDEIETSLHPNLCKLLIEVFHSPEYNPNGAQLIFTTHNISLLNNTIFRKDQIWLCQKDNYGATDFYSIQDFKDVREDTPFDRWYLAGKFGALPKIALPQISIKQNNTD